MGPHHVSCEPGERIDSGFDDEEHRAAPSSDFDEAGKADASNPRATNKVAPRVVPEGQQSSPLPNNLE
jgi:hypothetical protein